MNYVEIRKISTEIWKSFAVSEFIRKRSSSAEWSRLILDIESHVIFQLFSFAWQSSANTNWIILWIWWHFSFKLININRCSRREKVIFAHLILTMMITFSFHWKIFTKKSTNDFSFYENFFNWYIFVLFMLRELWRPRARYRTYVFSRRHKNSY